MLIRIAEHKNLYNIGFNDDLTKIIFQLSSNTRKKASHKQGYLKCIKGVQRKMVLVVNFFVFFYLNFVCFDFAIFDLVYDMEVTHGLFELLTAYGNLF